MSLTKRSLFPLAILFSVVIFLQACGDDDNNGPTGPDFSTVPEPYDLSQADTTYVKEGGVEVYVIEEGTCPGGEEEFCTVTDRDQISVYFTGRVLDEYIFDSSYQGGNEAPQPIFNLKPHVVGSGQQAIPPQVEGYRRGLLGMKEGEKRVIIVPPSLGYDDSRPTNRYRFDLRGETLRYDVELANIQE